MSNRIPRRQFLKSAPAASALAYAAAAHADANVDNDDVAPHVDVPEGAFALRDYPIRPKRYSEVALAGGFWKSRVDTNATVTIPFEFAKREESARLSNNVLEAAILSLATHPNAALEAKVDARVQQLRQAQPGLGNAGFEVAATYYLTTGRRDLLDHALASAALLAADFEAAPFDQSAGAPWGCFRREIPGARGTAIGTGRQNTADMAAHVDFPDLGRLHGDDKDFPRRVRAIRAF